MFNRILDWVTCRNRWIYAVVIALSFIIGLSTIHAGQMGGQMGGSNPKHGHSGAMDGGILFLASGESSATSNSTLVTIDLGTVTNGDKILISGHIYMSFSTAPTLTSEWPYGYFAKASGTATIVFCNTPQATNYFALGRNLSTTFRGSATALLKVTGSGTLVVAMVAYPSDGISPVYSNSLSTMFLLKQ
jgi:hypothetical protein